MYIETDKNVSCWLQLRKQAIFYYPEVARWKAKSIIETSLVGELQNAK